MRIVPYMVGADFYDALYGDWNYGTCFYERPPRVVIY
jgi:hypothetical protein